MLPVLNVAFFVLHTALILFNVFGWIPRCSRRWNLVTLLLTLGSWLLMGFWFGAGYCICTDLHWRVREAMGIQDHMDSYLALLVRTLTGWIPPAPLLNSVAGTIFLLCLAASLNLNLRDFREEKLARIRQ